MKRTIPDLKARLTQIIRPGVAFGIRATNHQNFENDLIDSLISVETYNTSNDFPEQGVENVLYIDKEKKMLYYYFDSHYFYFVPPVKLVSDKNLTCLATENNGDIASNTGITRKPKADSEIYIHVNGVMYEAGDGIDNKECYFTAPLETTPKTINTIQIGDILRWNGSVAGFQLETTDNITFIYLF